jgi:hypothetical protein
MTRDMAIPNTVTILGRASRLVVEEAVPKPREVEVEEEALTKLAWCSHRLFRSKRAAVVSL